MSKISGIFMLLVYICVATALINGDFLSSFNLENIARRSALFVIIGIGVAFVIITGGIDLSIGSLIGLVGCILPMLLRGYGWPVWAALLAVMAVAVSVGLFHGLLVTKLKLQPFVVTLCGLLIYRGLSRFITSDETQGFATEYNDSLRILATGKVCSAALVIMLVGALGVMWLLFRLATRFRELSEQRKLGVTYFGIAFCAALIVISSSRFWSGWETVESTSFTQVEAQQLVPETAAVMPGVLMYWIGLLSIPCVISFVAVGAMRNRQPLIAPCCALLIAIGLLGAAMWVGNCPNDWFWPNESWGPRWKMAAVFFSLASLMAGLAWFTRAGIRAGGEPAKLLAIMSAALGAMCLAGKCYIESAEIAEEVGERFEGFLVPAPFFIMVGVAIAAAIFLNLTIYGRYLLALGRNEEAARYSGIRTERMVILAYVLCSGLAGVGGILFALELNSVQPSGHGGYYELYAIAAAVLGGCSLRGGEGSILGVVIGAAVMRVLYNSILLVGIPGELEHAIIGVVILIGVIVDEIVHRIAARQRSRSAA